MGEPLLACATVLRATPLPELEADYVDTFDNRRRHNLFLTYFAHGDTRKRGMALLRFKQTYLASGFELDDTELPDHLCVVLEYAATIDREQGSRLILDHRAGLELLRISLTEAGSRWAGAVEAVTATLPPLRGDEMDAVRRLAAEGPPAEEVGLTPYETPAFDPGPARPDGPTPLPMPSFPRSPLMDTFLFVIVPYLCLATFVVGHFWRYRYDKFGWTTRSSQLYEDRMLRIGQPAVPLRHARGRRRARHRPAGARVLDRRRRHLGDDVPRRRGGGRPGRGPDGPGRAGHPDLPATHGRTGVLGDHADGQGDVRLPGRGDRAGDVEHGRRVDPVHRR